MRHVSFATEVPSYADLRARIGEPARYQPEPEFVSAPEMRPLPDGYFELRLRASGTWTRIHPMLAEVARALEAGLALAEVVERAKPLCPPHNIHLAERLVRNFVWRLSEEGHVRIPLEAPPEVFDGRYRWIKELGRGGIGVAHLCADEQDGGRAVVVKHAWGWNKPIERAEWSLRKEVHYLARLDHPRIPALVDAFEREGLLHMVRAFAPGSGLASVRPRLREVSSAERLAVLRGCAEALAHVHGRGLLYLDAKPDNFILGDAGPLLLDFGISRPLEGDVVHLRHAVGSPGFAAPEVVSGRVASVRSDVFSLGRVFLQLATGTTPRFRHKQEDVREKLVAAGVPEPEAGIILRMCADRPEDRYGSMAEVLAAIP